MTTTVEVERGTIIENERLIWEEGIRSAIEGGGAAQEVVRAGDKAAGTGAEGQIAAQNLGESEGSAQITVDGESGRWGDLEHSRGRKGHFVDAQRVIATRV